MSEDAATLRERLALSREKFRTLTMALSRALDEGIVLCTLDGRIVQANQAYLDMLGYTLAEARKLTYQQLTPAKWRAGEEDLRVNQVLQRGWCEVYEKEYIRKDGQIIPVRTQAWLVRDDDGRPLYLLGIFRDISREQTEP